MIPPQMMSGATTNQQYLEQEKLPLIMVLIMLLVLSAFPVTAKASIWAGLLLLIIVWLSAYSNGSLVGLGNELFNSFGYAQNTP